MGIKFLCPSGHKLHVKEFLAGKKALCPKCGARVVVPATSDSDASDAADNETGLGETGLGSIELAGVSNPGPGTAGEVARGAVWYVRPETGGQYGPATPEVLRGWLREKRIGPSSLVWRDGWAEWKNAASVFPQVADPASNSAILTQELAASETGVLAPQPVPMPDSAPLTKGARRRRQNDASVIASAILAGISIILIVVLFLVINHQRGSEGNASSPKPAAESQ